MITFDKCLNVELPCAELYGRFGIPSPTQTQPRCLWHRSKPLIRRHELQELKVLQVLIEFLATAYFAWILLVVNYVLVFDPSKAGLKADGDSKDPAEGADYPTNPIDEALLKFISKWFERPRDTWKDALEKVRRE